MSEPDVTYRAFTTEAANRLQDNGFRLMRALEDAIEPRIEKETRDAANAMRHAGNCTHDAYTVNNWLRRN